MKTYLTHIRLTGILLGPLSALVSASAQQVDFSHEIVPILRQHCAECHAGSEAKGGFSINSRELMLEAQVVEPGDPDASYLMELISASDPESRMPPEGKPGLSPREIDLLGHWVSEEMPWEAGFTFAEHVYEPPLLPHRPELPPPVAGRDHPVDRILDNYLGEQGLPLPDPIDDASYFRRLHLDLVGLLPEPEALAEFVHDQSSDKRRRAAERLLDDSVAYADHWLTFFNDLLRNDYSGTGFITGGRKQISGWLYESLLRNKPFDQMTRELIAPTPASTGFIDGIRWRGTVSAGQSNEIQFAQNVAQAFLGINLKCASCHDSFIDRWTLDEAYGLAAIYADEPLQVYRCDKPLDRTAQAAWLFPRLGTIDPDASRDERLRQLAGLMTDPDNGRFTRTIVNRLWYRLMGRGIVHPLDAMQTEPWCAPLLDFLAVDFADHGYDLKQALLTIVTSQAYQSRTVAIEQETVDTPFAGPRTRRMTAEQFLDAVWQLTGAAPTKMDAPVFRGELGEQPLADLNGEWIWKPSDSSTPPANQEIVLRKTFSLAEPIQRGGAIITCDNSYTLFINGRLVTGGSDWTEVQSIALQSRLQTGDNTIVVVAKNAGTGPNPAGLLFEARILLEGGDVVTVTSDETWQYSDKLPTPREGRLGRVQGPWASVTTVAPLAAWSAAVDDDARRLLHLAMTDEAPMIRASLLKNNALMQSLGRPIRDQIVSMRPASLTTLEAIDLANESGLAAAFQNGGRRLADREWESTNHLIEYLYRFALSRPPTEAERQALEGYFGKNPQPEAIADALWAICMLPEFLLVR